MSRTPVWRALLPAGIVVLVLVALVTPANRRWHGTQLSRDVTQQGPLPFATLALHAAPTASRAQFTHQVHVPGWIPWALATVAGLLAAFVLFLVVRALVPVLVDLLRRLRRRPALMSAGGALEPDVGWAVDTLRKRVDEAAATLAADRGTGGDSVIACWLVLEDAAAESGTARQPWQSPSEFTADLLVHHRADPAASARLLRLYQRARFGHETLARADRAAAAAALAAIADSLGASPTADPARTDETEPAPDALVTAPGTRDPA